MKPVAKLSKRFCRQLKGIFTDIDDTLSTHGKIPATSYAALWKAHKAGLRVIPITGRPAGWVDHIVRMWPVDAVVGENGAFYDYLDRNFGRDGKAVRRYLQDEETRRKNETKLFGVFERLRQELPHLQLASDQKYRAIDIAVDFCEDVARLPDREIDTIVQAFRQAGAQAKVSSIHVNAWFGTHNKFSTCELLLREMYNEPFSEVGDKYIYFGDSPNDEPMFAAFPTSVGVANVNDFAPSMQSLPTHVTQKKGGEGFAEAIHHILQARK